MKLFNLIEYRGDIEKQGAEYFIKIFDILEENFKRAEQQTDSEAKYQQNDNRNRREENIRSDVRLLVREKVEINNEADKHEQGNQEGYEG